MPISDDTLNQKIKGCQKSFYDQVHKEGASRVQSNPQIQKLFWDKKSARGVPPSRTHGFRKMFLTPLNIKNTIDPLISITPCLDWKVVSHQIGPGLSLLCVSVKRSWAPLVSPALTHSPTPRYHRHSSQENHQITFGLGWVEKTSPTSILTLREAPKTNFR